ncbi:PDZ domain-containing protein [Fusibacter sp. A1]|nr:PDZ domain-containing protein [Fusibacter sp. A1]
MEANMKKVIILLLAFSMAIMPIYADGVEKFDKGFENLQVMIDYIKANYYQEITDEDLLNAMYKGVMEALDPHSNYFTPSEYDDFYSSMEGSFSGVGISISPKDGYIEVIAPIKGTPGEASGILSGDLIVGVDGVDIKDFSMEKVVSMIRGITGTDVTLTVRRVNVKETFDITITRAVIELNTVEHSEVDGVDIISISSFDQNTAAHLSAVLSEEVFEHGVVIDLRNNPGGLLDQVVRICDYFLPVGDRIVTIDYASSTDYIYNSLSEGYTIPMVVLVNGGSASASEIFAAAMKENDRATVVGTQTYGKGTVQNIVGLPDDSAMKLTIAQYLTPDNVSIHGIGVTPDVVLENQTEYETVLTTFKPMNSLSISRRGSRDIDTYGLQERMRYLGYELTVDGSFGPVTEKLLRTLQEKLAIPVNGLLDVDTKIAIENAVQTEARSKQTDTQLTYAINLLK